MNYCAADSHYNYFEQAAVVYFFAEMVGATIGFGLLKLVTPKPIFELSTNGSAAGFCATAIHPTLSDWDGFALEFIATTLLILLCCACWDPRNAHNSDSVPLKFGFAITALALTFVSVK